MAPLIRSFYSNMGFKLCDGVFLEPLLIEPYMFMYNRFLGASNLEIIIRDALIKYKAKNRVLWLDV